MSVRRLFAGVAATSVLVSTAALVAPAQADPAFTPVASDVVGAGSDTSMYALSYLAEGHGGLTGYNAGRTTGRLVSFDAKTVDATGTQTNSATVTLVQGASPITRPNGSGAGKSLLHGAGNNPDVDYARSSSGLNAAEKSANLQAFPFAKDTLGMAVAATSNAPVTLTPAQIVGIYAGDITDWSAVGGKAGTIVPLIPQAGSGTRSFFEGELTTMNSGVKVTLSKAVKEVQEHDDSPVKDDPNAVAPFSVGRAGLLGTLRVTKGFEAARALYNVVRQADVAKPEITSIFGPTGFVCSPAAAPLIADAGFEQLLSQAEGGACGVATQDAPSLATALVETSTTVAAVSKVAGALEITATVGGGGALKPQGLVEFTVDGRDAGTALLSGGRATRTVTGLSAGTHTVKATFVADEGTVFSGSVSSEGTFTVAGPKAPVLVKSSLKETFKATNAKGKRAKGAVVVTLANKKKATGTVVIRDGKKVVAKGKVKNGRVTLTLKKLAKGKRTLVATYTGPTSVKGSTLRFVIRQR
ncbi:Ig-like domain repeat protein [Nocardioides daphniae]|uniref:Bacterial Ig-like domain-containing protein n=1 Tax=Nocardioides daphniae TaxID=402297 RepID=A0A4P7U9S4_9ACTN|nr:Ig-like domain repeat protein [Nocardioides daphniae]QCC76341.1 hypothetical protein E2C04_02375 [Nocardioides daphniae]GGD07757.1 hypothetical protein GCM10007231_03100 [Nocardioides daphniae]